MTTEKTTENFDYSTAFSRNTGWISQEEQEILRHKRIAIAGMGGVGGSHLITLTRLGIGSFHIADFDTFELANFNRQAGANLKNLNRPKVEAMAAAALNINPELNIKQFSGGVSEENISEFLDGVDLYIDGLDFFALSARRMVFDACAELAIPATTVAPLGMGAALLNFIPGKMGFEEYFKLEGHDENEQLIRFLLGLSPAMLQRSYLIDPRAVNFLQHRGPSTPMACELCAGIAGSEALKILLRRGEILAAPTGLHYDAHRNKLKHTWRPMGNNNPIQQIGLVIARRQINKMSQPQTNQPETAPTTTIEKILDLARWAPSGDNTQPWRFEIQDDSHLIIHGHDTRDHCVYDLQGHASQLSIGALLETIKIAASQFGLSSSCKRRTDSEENKPVFDIHFDPTNEPADTLANSIRRRSVQRRPMQTRPLTSTQKRLLATAVGEDYNIIWFEGWSQRWRITKLIFKNAGLRLTLPEAYLTHRNIIEWHAQFSEDRIPDQALGTTPVTTRLMQWALQSPQRVTFLNRYLAGTLMPRLEMEIIQGLACAAHFLLLAKHAPKTIDDYIAAGRAVQRFWLTATDLDLKLQPEMTPLIFHEYIRGDINFTDTRSCYQRAQKISRLMDDNLGPENSDRAIFMGRIGMAPQPRARSLRLPWQKLIQQTS